MSTPLRLAHRALARHPPRSLYSSSTSSLNLQALLVVRSRHTSLRRTFAMSRDVSSQSDITKMKTEPDGTFKRAAATFRDVIERGGTFEPEAGAQTFQ
jgi:hypothetical protein